MRIKEVHTAARAAAAAVCFLLIAWVEPLAAATLEFLPDTSSPGAEVLSRGDGYPALARIEFWLSATDGSGETRLGSVDADDSGLLFGRLTVPVDIAPGDYRASARDSRGTVLAAIRHTVTAAPPIRINPVSGSPGTPVIVEFGPVPAGTVEVFYDGVPVLGPLPHDGGLFSETFLAPADRPNPLGQSVQVRAVVVAGGSINGLAEASFMSLEPGPQDVNLTQFSGPGEPLSPGEAFTFSGTLGIPSNRDFGDYRLTLAVKAIDGQLIPINTRDITIDTDGNFFGEAVMASLVSGAPLAAFGADAELGLVYDNPYTGESGLLPVQPIDYDGFQVQTLKFHVQDDNQQPVEDAVFNVYANTMFVPPNYDFEADGIPGLVSPSSTQGLVAQAASGTVDKSTWSALYASPNQYDEGVQEIMDQTAMLTNPVTQCPVTLNQGLTNANGDFEVNVVPILNYLLDKAAQSVSQLDINTTVTGPGKATFTVNIQAVHLGLGANANGICGGKRYEFQYDYDTSLWKFRDGPDGPFDQPFDPDNDVLTTSLADCGVLQTAIPEDPYMPGVPSKAVTIDGNSARRIGALWSFQNTNGANLQIEKVPQLRLPHLSSAFGLLEDATLYLNNAEVGPLDVQGAYCGQDGIEYVIDLPQLASYAPGIIDGRVEGSMLSGTPVSKKFELDVRAGPTWINNSADYQNRIIHWKPEMVTLTADEPVRSQEANETGVDYGVGDLMNDNMTSGAVSHVLLPSGADFRKRSGLADSTAANEDASSVGNNASGNGSSPSNPVPFGSVDPITVLDTGKIPLFRYAWGLWPIASATVGADIWFKALYRYFGEIVATNAQILVDLTSEAIANAGLDLWFDVSVIFDVVDLTAFALPNFGLSMPLVLNDNQFDADASKPCFEFALDVAWNVAVGWCPFCIKGGDQTNLFSVAEPDNCSVPGVGSLLATLRAQAVAIPEIPAIDRTSIAVDGLGEASVVWGDASGMLNVQSMQAGQAVQLEQLAAGPGAMAPDIAYLGPAYRVMVWARSDLTEEAFYALDGDVQSAVQHQHLVYRVDDGTGWSSTMSLTAPTTGDGGVVLTACPWTDPACPSGGEILAVWVHDPAGNIGMHQMKLSYAYFDGTGWTAPQEVDPGSTAKDVQPAVMYLDGDPVVFWVRNDSVVVNGDSATFDLNQRRIAYRFLRQAAGIKIPSALPTGVASPSAQAFGSNALALAFSRATDPNAFIGTRRSLHTAFGTQCFAGECNFGNALERTDSLGRRIYVERPQLARNPQGQGVVTFRQLGTDAPRPSDAQGVLNHSGSLMQLVFEFNPVAPDPVADPFELATGGGVNWKVDAAFDPASNAVLTTVVSVEQAALTQGADQPVSSTESGTAHAVKTTRLPVAGPEASAQGVGGSPVVLVERPMLPDFELLDAGLEQAWIPEGTSVKLALTLRNNGSPWEEAADLQAATYWDGPAGLGMPGPSLAIADLESAKATGFALDISLPEGFNADDEHALHVVVNPQGALQESDGGNNEIVLSVGALPVPSGLSVFDSDASGTIVVHWDPIDDDPRVTGYRVYRRNPDKSVLIVGSSPVAGFADFSVYPGQKYEYFVTSHSARLIESKSSDPIFTQTVLPEVLFRDGFEDIAP